MESKYGMWREINKGWESSVIFLIRAVVDQEAVKIYIKKGLIIVNNMVSTILSLNRGWLHYLVYSAGG